MPASAAQARRLCQLPRQCHSRFHCTINTASASTPTSASIFSTTQHYFPTQPATPATPIPHPISYTPTPFNLALQSCPSITSDSGPCTLFPHPLPLTCAPAMAAASPVAGGYSSVLLLTRSMIQELTLVIASMSMTPPSSPLSTDCKMSSQPSEYESHPCSDARSHH